MPIVPSFNSFAPVPRLAETRLGYDRLDLERRKLQQDALESQQRQQLARQELDQRRVQAEMEMAVKMQDLVQENLLKQQQLEITKAYQKANLGLAADRISRQQQADQMRNALGLATLEQRGQLGTQRINIEQQKADQAGQLALERINESLQRQGQQEWEVQQQNAFLKTFNDYWDKNPDGNFEDATKAGIGAAGLYRQAAQITGRAQGTDNGVDRVETRSINRERRDIARDKADAIQKWLDNQPAHYVAYAEEMERTGKPGKEWAGQEMIVGAVKRIMAKRAELRQALSDLGAFYSTPKAYVPGATGTNAPTAVPTPLGTNRIVRPVR
jgi:hypothetical protein